MSIVTTIALQSVHRPTEKEIEVVLDSLLAVGEQQGFEPLRAQAIYTPKDDDILRASRVVNDGVVQAKWRHRG